MVKLFAMVLALSLMTVGCGSSEGGGAHPLFRKAQYYREQGNYFEAARLLRSFVARNPKSSLGYYALASVYDENLNKPLQAAFFYEEYLELEPESPQRDSVIKSITRCRARYVKEASDAGLADSEETKKIKSENAKLKQINASYSKFITQLTQENRKLKDALATEPAQGEAVLKSVEGKELSASGALIGEVDFDKLRSGVGLPREYIVKAGDSLAQISQNIYGTAKYYNEIMKANSLHSANRLMVGQKLIIPQLSK